jgi:hypothetical protein
MNIRCPSLALVGEGEGPAAMNLFENFSRGVGGAVTRRIFTTAEGPIAIANSVTCLCPMR